MAPHSVMFSSFEHPHFSDKEKLKLRKPIVEKMRRDRINSCIDQLKAMMEKEFQNRDPSTKLEKADILEMTVSFLKQQLRVPQKDYSEGYSHCWRESVQFLTLHSTEGSGRELQTLHKASSSTPAPAPRLPPEEKTSIWRPW